MEDTKNRGGELVAMTAEIAAAYVANNSVAQTDLTALIAGIYRSLSLLGATEAEVQPEPVPLVPAVPIKKSVTPDYIVCLEDGKKFKSLKRHLATHYGMTPDEYRRKWGLPSNYPMVAPAYGAQRSEMALRMGLGRKNTKPAAEPARKSGRGRNVA